MADIDIVFGTNADETEREIRKLNRTVDKAERNEKELARATKRNADAQTKATRAVSDRTRKLNAEVQAIKRKTRAERDSARTADQARQRQGRILRGVGRIGGVAGTQIAGAAEGLEGGKGIAALSIAAGATAGVLQALMAGADRAAQSMLQVAQSAQATRRAMRQARGARGGTAAGVLGGANLQLERQAAALGVRPEDIADAARRGAADPLAAAVAGRKFGTGRIGGMQTPVSRVAEQLTQLGVTGSLEEALSLPDLGGRVQRAGGAQVLREEVSKMFGRNVGQADIERMLGRGPSAAVSAIEQFRQGQFGVQQQMRSAFMTPEGAASAVGSIRNAMSDALAPNAKILLDQHNTQRDQLIVLREVASQQSFFMELLRDFTSAEGSFRTQTKRQAKQMGAVDTAVGGL